MFSLGCAIAGLSYSADHPQEVYVPRWALRAGCVAIALDLAVFLTVILFRSLVCSSS